MGESFGGMHALHAALRHPDRVGRLVLANTSPAFGARRHRPRRLARHLASPHWTQDSPPADIAAAGAHLQSRAPALGTDDVLAMRVAGFARIPAAGLRAAVECLPTHDVRDRLGEIAAPALVIAGELDAETPVAYSRLLFRGLPDAELVVLDGVGHLAVSEVPQTFNRLVRDFLGRRQMAGPSGQVWADPGYFGLHHGAIDICSE